MSFFIENPSVTLKSNCLKLNLFSHSMKLIFFFFKVLIKNFVDYFIEIISIES